MVTSRGAGRRCIPLPSHIMVLNLVAMVCLAIPVLPSRALAAAASSATSASTGAKAEKEHHLKAKYHRAFQAMIHDITNLDKTFAFAELAVQVGDYEGAISAFERMLLIDPNLPQVKAELGALYMRLGSYRMAQSYLQSALASPNVPAPVQVHIKKLLAKVKERLQPNHLFGSLTFGARFQSNANAGPSSSLVQVGGSLATLSNQYTSKRDWNAFVLGQATDIYDFQTQGGTTLETDATIYGADQQREKQVNVGFAELSMGPRFKLFPSAIVNATIKPYGIIDIVTIGHARDYWAGGAGLDVTKLLTPTISLDLVSELRDRIFRNSSELPVNDLQTGLQSYSRIGLAEQVTPRLSFLEAIAFTNNRAKRKVYANREYAGTLGVTYRYVPAFALEAGGPWVASLVGTHTITPYATPDPTVNSNVSREDKDWELDFSITIPVNQRLALVGGIGIFERGSTLPNYRFTNKYASVALTWRF